MVVAINSRCEQMVSRCVNYCLVLLVMLIPINSEISWQLPTALKAGGGFGRGRGELGQLNYFCLIVVSD